MVLVYDDRATIVVAFHAIPVELVPGFDIAALVFPAVMDRIGYRLDDGEAIAKDRLLFEFALSDFGRQRMLDTGLLDGVTTND